mmetsp:Transcript_53044/g.141817  ORF Transcript_53044/g.141817 Transcript_53044/m.141817 type:complete len:329 (-) Transcript_53044:17-1003(-)
MRLGRSISVVLPKCLAALLSRDDVRVKRRIAARIHSFSDVSTKLHKKHLAAVVLIDFGKLGQCIFVRQMQPQHCHSTDELFSVYPPVISCVDHVEHLPELAEPKDVEQQRVKLIFLHPVVSVAIQENCLLVGTHQCWLGVEPYGPHTASHQLDDHLVDFSEAHNVVAIVIKTLPELSQRLVVDDAVLPHLALKRHAQLHERVVESLRWCAGHVGVGTPLSIFSTTDPWTLASIRRPSRVPHKGKAPSAVVEPLADDPTALPRMENVHWLHRAGHPTWFVMVQIWHWLEDAINQLVPSLPPLDHQCVHRKRPNKLVGRTNWHFRRHTSS